LAIRRPSTPIPAIFGYGTCVLALWMSSAPALAQTAEQDQTMTATALAPNKSDACTASMGKAYGLCTAEGPLQHQRRDLRLQSTEHSGSAVGMRVNRHMHEIAHYAERQTSSEVRNWLEWVKLQ
jgi:hypothetical protein